MRIPVHLFAPLPEYKDPMTEEQREVYNKLNNLDLDKESYSMVDRLAKENNWSKRYAEAVFFEYKRFMFLAKFAGHMVTPSYEIDQAWHIHLIYSKSYWNTMCGEILDKKIHHNPGTGEEGDEEKFKEAYWNTRDSYKKFFNYDPPSAIWNSWHKPKGSSTPWYKSLFLTILRNV